MWVDLKVLEYRENLVLSGHSESGNFDQLQYHITYYQSPSLDPRYAGIESIPTTLRDHASLPTVDHNIGS